MTAHQIRPDNTSGASWIAVLASAELPERTWVGIRIDLAEGRYRLLCAVPGHEDMTATMVVD